ncbi:unnamed protein product [Symbiodinium sp. CCMP2592]|nr:unnamed protein product [Symbiodinium sp. CCMP2592]
MEEELREASEVNAAALAAGADALPPPFVDGATYQAWEDWAMATELNEAPCRKRRWMQVEIATGSHDAPRVARVVSVPVPPPGIPLTITATIHEVNATADAPSTVGASEAPTVAVPPGPPATALDEETDPLFGLSMEEYFEVYRLWSTGALTGDQVQARHGASVRELIETQWMAEGGAFDTVPSTGLVVPVNEQPMDGHEGPGSRDEITNTGTKEDDENA